MPGIKDKQKDDDIEVEKLMAKVEVGNIKKVIEQLEDEDVALILSLVVFGGSKSHLANSIFGSGNWGRREKDQLVAVLNTVQRKIVEILKRSGVQQNFLSGKAGKKLGFLEK